MSSTTLDNNSNSKSEVQILHKEKDSIQRELQDIRDFITRAPLRQKELYIRWAQVLERLAALGDITLKKNEICGSIAKAIKTRNGTESEIVYMYNCLPIEYKTSHELKAISTNELYNLALQNKNVAEESKAIEKEAFRGVASLRTLDFAHFTKAGLQELAMQANEFAEQCKEACSDRHYDVVDTTSPDQSWQDELAKTNQFAEKYSINKPRPKKGYFHQALIDFRDLVGACADKAEEYSGELKDENGTVIRPAISEEDDKRFAKGVYALCCLFAPYVDDKWRRDWFQWYKIVKDRLEYSLHGAMSKSKLPTVMAGALRGVTREQIDAKVPVVYKFWKQIGEDMPGIFAMHEFYTKYQQPFLGDLTMRMREKMSFLS